MTERKKFDVVTGGFGYTGKYVCQRLLDLGRAVRTLTSRAESHSPFGNLVRAFPLDFGHPKKLVESLRGTTILYNTYWVRFPHGRITFDKAVKNTKILIQAAEDAGVRRLVHVSITNASTASPLPYFRGKGIVEDVIRKSRLSYAVIRPTVVFGPEDILINNIGWLLRKMPVFGIPGSGTYRLQPIFVEDLADIMVRAGQKRENLVLDAVGPDILTFEQLVRLIADKVQSRVRFIHLEPWLTLLVAKSIGWMTRDVVLTKDELDGLMANLLVSADRPTGRTRLCHWLSHHGDSLGTSYASELRRHYRLS